MSASHLLDNLQRADLLRVHGRVLRSVGPLLEASGPPAFVGEICHVHASRTEPPATAEVVGFAEGRVFLMPWSSSAGIRPGAEVVGTGNALSVPVGRELLGRVIDGLGRPLDGKGPLRATQHRSVRAETLNPLERVTETTPLVTGVRALDALVTCARGQRLGLFAGGGVGKSVLMGMIARTSQADVNVVALIGERGREVMNFLENELGPEGLAKSVVVVATSDDTPLKRVQAARVAATVAESFREDGLDALLLMDSLTRVAMAQREIGLSAGEPPTTRGYPPSSFSILPEIVERAGATTRGSVTGFYTVLLEGDDVDAPLSDAARAVLDGHLMLSRELATAGHYPAIDPLESVSRLRDDVQDDEMLPACREVVRLLAARREMADLISIGAYKAGADPDVDRAVALAGPIQKFLRQGRDEASSWDETRTGLMELVKKRSPKVKPAATEGADVPVG
ncbi:MAG: FliI/YscN family ATPase [Gemmatimonadetes bacterium]|nr:FliI/YscN family ATPase [Gemmatimonadota bacterium]